MPYRASLFAKLRKLPVDFLLAFINATAILVIVAALVALIAIARVNTFGRDLAATMTDAVLSRIDLPSREVLANLQNVAGEIRSFGNSLREFRKGENPILQSEMARLEEAMTRLNVNIDRLTTVRTILTDEAINRLSRSVSDTLTRLRACSSETAQEKSPKNSLRVCQPVRIANQSTETAVSALVALEPAEALITPAHSVGSEACAQTSMWSRQEPPTRSPGEALRYSARLWWQCPPILGSSSTYAHPTECIMPLGPER